MSKAGPFQVKLACGRERMHLFRELKRSASAATATAAVSVRVGGHKQLNGTVKGVIFSILNTFPSS
jgi:hypothetical protein